MSAIIDDDLVDAVAVAIYGKANHELPPFGMVSALYHDMARAALAVAVPAIVARVEQAIHQQADEVYRLLGQTPPRALTKEGSKP